MHLNSREMALVNGYSNKAEHVNESNLQPFADKIPSKHKVRHLRKEDIHELHSWNSDHDYCHVNSRSH